MRSGFGMATLVDGAAAVSSGGEGEVDECYPLTVDYCGVCGMPPEVRMRYSSYATMELQTFLLYSVLRVRPRPCQVLRVDEGQPSRPLRQDRAERYVVW